MRLGGCKRLALAIAVVLAFACGLPAAASAEAELVVEPPAIEFGEVTLGESSGVEFVTVANEGDEPLEFAEIRLGGENSLDFNLLSGCSPELEPGEECEIEVFFEPFAAGPREATLEVETFGAGFGEVLLFGEGVGVPEAEIEPSFHEFGEVVANEGSDSETFVIRSIGTGPLEPQGAELVGTDAADFEISFDGCAEEVLEPGEECEIEVEFLPLTAGLKEATLRVETNTEEGEVTAELLGTGEANPGISISPELWEFAATPVGEPGFSQSFIVESTGTTPLTIEEALVEGPDSGSFPLEFDGCSSEVLEPEETCEIEVGFEPQEGGELEASLVVSSDAPEAEAEVFLFGIGETSPEASLTPSSKAFGNVAVGESSATTYFTLESNGTGPLTVSAVEIGGSGSAEFQIIEDGCTDEVLEPLEECEIGVFFEPFATGAAAADLEVFTDAADSPHTASLSGTGLANPIASISPASNDFGNVPIGDTSPSQQFEVENTGFTTLEVEAVEIGGSNPGEFELDAEACEEAELEPGETCTVEVAFAPTAPGPATATIEVESDSAEADPTATVEGNGVAIASTSLTPASHDFGAVEVGSESATQAFTLENTGNVPFAPPDPRLGGADASQFAIASEDCDGATLAPEETCQVKVAFLPKSTGAKDGALEIGNESATDASAALTGSGSEKPSGGGSGGGNTPPPPPPPTCPPIAVTQLAPYQPQAKKKATALGLRARFVTDASATVDVSAAVQFKASGKTRTASLGKSTLDVAGGLANFKVKIPAKLKPLLPLGTKVTLKLTYSTKTSATACSTFGPPQRKNLRTRVTWITP